MDHESLIHQQLELLLQKKLELHPGDTACHLSHPVVHVFVEYKNDIAVLRSTDRALLEFPAGEVFDPNILKNMCINALITKLTNTSQDTHE